MFKIEIEEMNIEHLDGLMIVEHLSFTVPWSKNAFMEELCGNKFARYFVAVTDNRVVGYAGMWKVFDEGHITNIAVHPEFRCSGVGSALLERLIIDARDSGVSGLTLEVRKSNLAAQKLYKKYGFSIEGERKSYYADNGEDAVIMWKHDINGMS